MTPLTIGQLASRVGLRTSTLRYYEEQGLLIPIDRTEAGYRLYAPEAEQRLRFIQRAQRLGFSLADIRALLDGLQHENLSDQAVVGIAEERFLAVERQLTELLVKRHEIELFLRDFRAQMAEQDNASAALFDRLLDRVCHVPTSEPEFASMLDWLVERTGCALATPDGRDVLNALNGRHIHIWQEDDAYCILVIGHDPAVEEALRTLLQLEEYCSVHPAPSLDMHEEGLLVIARGENAFLYARLFLALEGDAEL